MTLRQLSGPGGPAVPLLALQEHLRVDDDALPEVSGYLQAATAWVESYLSRSLITQNWRLELQNWPAGRSIELRRGPVASILSIRCLGLDGVESEVPEELWVLDGAAVPSSLYLKAGATWPAAQRQPGAIKIEYSAGFGESWNDVPEPIRLALMMLTAHFHENREAAAPGSPMGMIPFGVPLLLDQYRTRSHATCV